MRLLLIEDDPMLGASIRMGFQPYGFTVDWVQDGDAADEALEAESFSTVLLDLGLPRKSGLEVLRNLRGRRDDTPVIILSARDAVPDRIAGLDAGADDYLNKPFDLDELAARIRAVRRRRDGRTSSVLRHGAIAFDPATMTVSYHGKTVSLRTRELALLAALIERPGAVLSRNQLIDKIYGWGADIESNTIEVHVHALRKKFSPGIVRNIRGIGYVLADEYSTLVD
ncbi:DNA-binding response regulator [Phenylobacterium hankyongense]|uniref:DNA-binding response regulator n=1 Tax=Phenylobacterium hankyongense TaxID=1813876 RepID=A0A328B3A4_9CAUL|nr:response regulator transcription factor [Phenylobacterium hankyongense]RAK61379.1 DNA-binding response regulator [Phenylobacterium hankyongense]